MCPEWTKSLAGYLENEDRQNAHKTCMDALATGETTIRDLYENILAPALNRIGGDEARESETIWREHVMSGIVRGIVESAFPYVMKEREEKNLMCDDHVLVFCPAGEDHELGARMAADFFLVWGYKTMFIGANTPEKTLFDAIDRTSPKYLCISVTNDFNLFATRRLIADVRAKYGNDLAILVGGRAVAGNSKILVEIGADRYISGYEDIGRLRTGVGS